MKLKLLNGHIIELSTEEEILQRKKELLESPNKDINILDLLLKNI